MPTYRLTYDKPAPQRARRLAAFIALSLLIHGLLLFLMLRHPQQDMQPVEQLPSASMSVRLLPPAPPVAAAQPKPESPPPRQRQPRAKPVRPHPQPRIARRAPAVPSLPPPLPSAKPEPQPAAPPEIDMMSMINARRAQRQAVEQEAAALNAQAAQESRGMSPNDVALANINRDLQRRVGQRDAIGGLFRIISKGPRMATYQFRGWTPASNARWQQTIEVDAGPGGDVDLAIVRSIIELIRKHHDGDFSWESHRLGRVVTLSARPRDNAELEAFLLKEFFGA